jgi:3-oxoacyl-[acyl-carrier-protein] synthase-3
MVKHQFTVDDFDYFLPHMSSMYFKKKIYDGLKERGVEIPSGKWFTNLPEVGNIGAASAFFMIEELFNSGNLNRGEKILIMVPESARFSYTYMMLKVV